MKTVALLGATGSIGRSTQALLAANPDRYRLTSLTANRDVAALADAARRFRALRAVIAEEALLADLRDRLAGSGVEAAAGEAALCEAAAAPADIVVSAIVGAAGLKPTAAALKAGRRVALANKECLVCAGGAFMRLAEASGARVLPVDSEHNAVFQLIEARDEGAIETVILTCSGGPFRTWTPEAMEAATPEAALRHPTWSMGAKISIDSATLMNKGLELIEAHHLFGLAPTQLDVVVHPQSVVHAIVRFRDGSLHAEMGLADMRRPIGHCLDWPERSRAAPAKPLDLAEIGTLSFERPDTARFPALGLARAALARGAGAPAVLNAANEVAVQHFLNHMIGFTHIARIVEDVLEEAERRQLLAEPGSVEDALALDAEGRDIAKRLAAKRTGR